jgi:hypothetical protein
MKYSLELQICMLGGIEIHSRHNLEEQKDLAKLFN